MEKNDFRFKSFTDTSYNFDDFDSVSLIGFRFLNWCWHQSSPLIILKIFSGGFMAFNYFSFDISFIPF